MGDVSTGDRSRESWPDWAMPRRVVEDIFSVLVVRYGTAWTSRVVADPELVARDWALGLAGFRPEAIRWGLDNLPDDAPPLLGQFRAACGRCPPPAMPALAAPRADPERVADALARMRSGVCDGGPRAWAYRLRDRYQRGERLTRAQVDAYEAAVR